MGTVELDLSNWMPTMQAIKQGCSDLMNECGERYYDVALNECPVSDVDTPGYVHLAETINYELATGINSSPTRARRVVLDA